MKIAIRVDASHTVGRGHLYRCLALADAFKRRGDAVFFICRAQKGDAIEWLRGRKGHDVFVLPECKEQNSPAVDTGDYRDWLKGDPGTDSLETLEAIKQAGGADLLVIDHYALDNDWERTVSGCVKKILVIDDLVSRKHFCDALVNPTVVDDAQACRGFVPSRCLVMTGPEYAPLRSEFLAERINQSTKKRQGRVRDILIFPGGGDTDSFTAMLIEGIRQTRLPDARFHFVAGGDSLAIKGMIKAQLSNHHCRFYADVDNMASLMGQMDLYLGSGGSITWERCCLGLTGAVVSMEVNQFHFNKLLGEQGCHLFLGNRTDLGANDITTALQGLIKNQGQMAEMSAKSIRLVDGYGAQRVVEAIHKL
ncbi:MAG: UDP-2,4-diacetamido-2,4,6-trideoxy-beta-L-altropyranose hydrolase [Deltaproteobacteria bacterium]|nr:UDP-2,4-diacetamido-2,4,6-trideoxy-beta-L-altropyranose hydrolase [Deltaproteobacteria bacterium]